MVPDIKEKYDICVIGAGASGLAAAICAAGEHPGLAVVVLEKNSLPGRKIAASGNGRCNLSNIACQEREPVWGFFSSVGILTRTDASGRMYPYSEDGRDVVEALVRASERLGVQIICDCGVSEVRCAGEDRRGDGAGGGPETLPVRGDAGFRFTVRSSYGPVRAERLLIATGGKAAPGLGTTGDGFAFARSLGHHVSTLIPVLTAVDTVEDIGAMGLSGLREKGELVLKRRGREVFRERGEIQFIDTGISGICTFDMTRFMDIPPGTPLREGFRDYRIELDFMPEFALSDIERLISEGGLATLVKRPLAELIEKRCRGAAASAAGGRGPAAEEAAALKCFSLEPRGLRGWERAQMTRGGVPLSEVDPATQESLLIPGLYFAGEILDWDGPCGGFNLHHAWLTGIRAGRAMALMRSF